MPKTSRFFSLEREQICEFALRIESRMHKLGLSVSDLSKKCSVAAAELAVDEDCPSLSRPRIAKILMNRRASPGMTAAKAVSRTELMILASALGVSVEWLTGQRDNEDPIIWDILAQPERAAHLIHLLEEYGERTGKITVWSEYLLCPFVTEEFMYIFHDAHFGEMNIPGTQTDKRRLVEFFNKVGNARRRYALRPGRPASFAPPGRAGRRA